MSQPCSEEGRWPPRSPHDVLLSTPGGRERLRRLAQRSSLSPSPIKRSNSTPSLRSPAKQRIGTDAGLEDLAEDEDDEETLQLQLQEIQARLKLKKLQKKTKQGSDAENDANRAGSVPPSRANSAATSRAQSRIAGIREERLQRSKSQTSVHVPVSPIRRVQPIENPRSPGRVLLGIDKGLKGSDVSLKRAPSLRRTQDTDFQDTKLAGPFLRRVSSQTDSRASGTSASSQSSTTDDRPKSFSERLAASRAQETSRQERDLRIKKSRSMAFDIDHEEMKNFKEAAVALPEVPRPAPAFSRDEVVNSYGSSGGNLARSKTTPNLRSEMQNTIDTTGTAMATSTKSKPGNPTDKPMQKGTNKKSKALPGEVTESEASQFEPYSSIHLSKRVVPHKVLTRTLTGKKTFVISDLLRIVKAPDFSGPDVEEDVVVFAIIARKSDPRSHQSQNKTENRGKYMVMTLTDLKWELDLYLFDSAFEKFWKLTPGSIMAILNPGFLPPPRGRADTGKFSLTLNSNADTILEIGVARDLGFCKSVKQNGKTCDSWVDKRHTEFCDYHVNETLKKTHASRMEVSTMTFGRGQHIDRKFSSRNLTGFLERRKVAELEQKTRYDVGSHSQIFIGKTAKLLDDVDFDPDAFHRGTTKEERMTRQLIAQEKERDLAQKLAKLGGGLGADYMRKRDASSRVDPNSSNATAAETETETAPLDAAALGLLGGKAKDVHLSPVKRKRPATLSTATATAMGWGSNLSKELSKMKSGENLLPVKKKTRFVTEKGIREAGRESVGGEAAKSAAFNNDEDDDDDDDLEIVR